MYVRIAMARKNSKVTRMKNIPNFCKNGIAKYDI